MRAPLQPVAPSIEDPIELLLACHGKVRRFAGLTVRLRDHLEQNGIDAQAQEAAQSILRYFDIAAPLHHDDEERDLFPLLQALGDGPLNEAIDQLNAEHGVLHQLWQSLRPWLQDIAAGLAHPAPETVDTFAQRYTAHAQKEEGAVYPFATKLHADQLRNISAAMVARRRS